MPTAWFHQKWKTMSHLFLKAKQLCYFHQVNVIYNETLLELVLVLHSRIRLCCIFWKHFTDYSDKVKKNFSSFNFWKSFIIHFFMLQWFSRIGTFPLFHAENCQQIIRLFNKWTAFTESKKWESIVVKNIISNNKKLFCCMLICWVLFYLKL